MEWDSTGEELHAAGYGGQPHDACAVLAALQRNFKVELFRRP